MKRVLLWAVVLGLSAVADLRAEAWFTDYAKAQAAAQEQQKPILLDFTGSDWCGWCMKFDKETFETPAFKKYAEEKLILMKVDFPQHKPLSAAEKQQNAALAAKYGVQGYPTLILLGADGKKLMTQPGYEPGGPQAFIAKLDAAQK